MKQFINLIVSFFVLTALICGLTACNSTSDSAANTATVIAKMKASEILPSVRDARGRVTQDNSVWAYLELEGDKSPISLPTNLSNDGYYVAAFSIRASANVVKASFKRVFGENPANAALLNYKYESIDTSQTEPKIIIVGAEDTAAAYVAEAIALEASFQELAEKSLKVITSKKKQVKDLVNDLAEKIKSRAKAVFSQTELGKAKQETQETEQEITDRAQEIAAELEKKEDKPEAYTVKLNCDGGTGALVNNKAYNESAVFAAGELITLTAPTKATFAFAGWNVVSGGISLATDTANPLKHTFTMPAKAVELKAVWTKSRYNVNIIGSEAEQSGVGSYSWSEEVTVNAGTRDGFTFNGWAASGITLTEEQKQKGEFTFTMPTNDVELTANWLKLKYEYNSENSGYIVTGMIEATNTDIIIPSVYNDGENGKHPVIAIGNKAFYDCTNLTSITIPDSVTSIGYQAFDECTGLTSINIPDSVTSIGRYAFSLCNLTSITIPDSVTSIGDNVLVGCFKLSRATLSNHITTIPQNTFYNCPELTSITIPNSVTSIEDEAFECSGLTSITIPDSVTHIGKSAFEGCSKLDRIDFAGSVTQWNSMDRNEYWLDNPDYDRGATPPTATVVHCNDGDVNI